MTDTKFRWLFRKWKDFDVTQAPVFLYYQEFMMYAVKYPDGGNAVEQQIPGYFLDGARLAANYLSRFHWEA